MEREAEERVLSAERAEGQESTAGEFQAMEMAGREEELEEGRRGEAARRGAQARREDEEEDKDR